MKTIPFHNDLHVHTNLSFCAPSDVTAATYLPLCREEGLSLLGFTNHLYHARHLEKRGLTDITGVAYALRLREELEHFRDTAPVPILFGCEVEHFYNQGPSLAVEDASEFDYVLIAASHILNFPGEYINYDLSTPEKLRKMVIDQFVRACELEYPVPTGICHPLYPILSPWEQEIVDGITDSQLEECFKLAAEKNKSIEIHACIYRSGTQRDAEGISPSYLRMLSAAKACGCKFHFGSDAHKADAFRGKHKLLLRAAERVGITEADMWPLLDEKKHPTKLDGSDACVEPLYFKEW